MPALRQPPRRPVATSRRRGRALLPTLVVLGVLLIAFSMFTGFYTDLLWYRSVGYTVVFTTDARRPRRCCSSSSASCSRPSWR